MLMFAGQVFLGRVDPVRVSNGGTDVHFESFAATSIVRDEPRNVGALLFYEACAHIAWFHPSVQVITFASSRPIMAEGEARLQAAARIAALERIGTTNIRVTPMPSGRIVVSGEWVYNAENMNALELALQEYRAMFLALPIGRGKHWPQWWRRLRRALRRPIKG